MRNKQNGIQLRELIIKSVESQNRTEENVL